MAQSKEDEISESIARQRSYKALGLLAAAVAIAAWALVAFDGIWSIVTAGLCAVVGVLEWRSYRKHAAEAAALGKRR